MSEEERNAGHSKRRKRRSRSKLVSADPSLDRYYRPTRRTLVVLGIVFVVVATPVLGLSAFLRLWQNTPNNVSPAIKVSLIDFVQARALTRSALAHEAKGRWEDAVSAWMGAVGNTPGDLFRVRRLLSATQMIPPNLKTFRETTQYGTWLLELSRNDPRDVHLVASSLYRCRRHSELVSLIRSQKGPLDPATVLLFSRTLFMQGDFKGSQDALAKLAPSAGPSPTAQALALANTAILAGEASRYADFSERLLFLLAAGDESVELLRIGLRTHLEFQDVAASRRMIERLASQHQLEPLDLVRYWNLLLENDPAGGVGQVFEVADPLTEEEALEWSKVIRQIDTVEHALNMSREMLSRFPVSLKLWLDIGNWLNEIRHWDELKKHAQHIKLSSALDSLKSIATFWEGLTEYHTGEKVLAEELFDKIAETSPMTLNSSLSIAEQLYGLGQREAGWSVITAWEKALGGDERYWILRCKLAVADRNLPALVESARAGYARDPDSFVNINNFAVALLIQRSDPKQALSLTRKLVEFDSDSIPYRLNLVHALIQNGEVDEAQSRLEGLGGASVRSLELLADFQLARFELHFMKKQYRDALMIYKGYNMALYMPQVVAWIERAAAISKARLLGREK